MKTISVNKRPDRPSARYILDGVDRTNQLFQLDLSRRIARGHVTRDGKTVRVIRGKVLTFTRRYDELRIVRRDTSEEIDPETIIDTEL